MSTTTTMILGCVAVSFLVLFILLLLTPEDRNG